MHHNFSKDILSSRSTYNTFLLKTWYIHITDRLNSLLFFIRISFICLKRKSCFCLNKEENRTVTIVPYKACTDICPGMSRDKCGGKDVFTFYEFCKYSIILSSLIMLTNKDT
jgi:hypothetical protein